MSEPGLDLHDWASRWESVAEVRADDPAAALSHLADIAEEMLVASGLDVQDPVQSNGAEPGIVRTYVAAREVAERAELGEASRSEVEDALGDLDELYATLVAERSEA